MPDELAEMRDRQDQFQERQGKFDARLTTLEETVQAEATLRAAMDRDVSDIRIEQRAQRGLLQAIAITQSDHTMRLAEHSQALSEHTQALGEVRAGVQTIISMLDRSTGTDGGGRQ
jgi:succinate dehydrogenase/fumarate reductase flavoprotein subunit